MSKSIEQFGFKKSVDGLIINTDESYYKQLKLMRSQRKQTEAVCEKMQVLESELTEIKNLLVQVINGKQNG